MAVDNDEDDNIHANDIENEDRVVEASDDSEDSGLDSDEERQRSGRWPHTFSVDLRMMFQDCHTLLKFVLCCYFIL